MAITVYKLRMTDDSNPPFAPGEEFALPAGDQLYRLIGHNHAVFSNPSDLTANQAGHQ
jgi:hypothetical protein